MTYWQQYLIVVKTELRINEGACMCLLVWGALWVRSGSFVSACAGMRWPGAIVLAGAIFRKHC